VNYQKKINFCPKTKTMDCRTVALWRPIESYLNEFYRNKYIDRPFVFPVPTIEPIIRRRESIIIAANGFRCTSFTYAHADFGSLFDPNGITKYSNSDGFFVTTPKNNPWSHYHAMGNVNYPITPSQFEIINKLLDKSETIFPPKQSLARYMSMVNREVVPKIESCLDENGFFNRRPPFIMARKSNTVMDLLVWVQTEREERAKVNSMRRKMLNGLNKLCDVIVMCQ
jgi:hypothetical protein